MSDIHRLSYIIIITNPTRPTKKKKKKKGEQQWQRNGPICGSNTDREVVTKSKMAAGSIMKMVTMTSIVLALTDSLRFLRDL